MKSRFLTQWVANSLRDRPVRANSLIITVYGDSIAPHGGTVWLGSFINLVRPLGLNDRLVRTSVFRLSRDQWLESQHIGRLSYYSLTATGRRRFEHAYRRIYSQPDTQWDGQWQLVLSGGNELSPEQREAVRKELLWEGFGLIAPGVLAHPSANLDSLMDILQSNEVQDKLVVLKANTLGPLSTNPLRDLVRECWNLEAVAKDYELFLDHYSPVLRAVTATAELDPEQCFLVRTLLMHEFRRTLLRDPQLPAQLLPKGWPGDAARQLCRNLYLRTQQGAETHIMSILQTTNGRLPEAEPYFYERFGGLGTPTVD